MEAVGQLAGGIAHDFNNLLTAILGYSDLILAGGSSTVDEVRPDLEEIKRAGERASSSHPADPGLLPPPGPAGRRWSR